MPPATSTLSRGHLSRPACSHVKQVAKRPGTREPGRDFSPAGFLLATRVVPKGGLPVFGKDQAQGLRRPRCPRLTKSYRPETRLVHAGTLRSQFGEISEALFLTQGYIYPTRRGMRGALLRQDPGLRLFALLQPDHEHVRAAHGRLSKAPRPRDRPQPEWPPSPPR